MYIKKINLQFIEWYEERVYCVIFKLLHENNYVKYYFIIYYRRTIIHDLKVYMKRTTTISREF